MTDALALSFTKDQLDLIKRTVCSPKVGEVITDDEFKLFVEKCRRTGMDPLLQEAYCVPRKQNVGSKEHPRWITKFEFQVSEGGMLSRADNFTDYRGVSAAAVYENDICTIDIPNGIVEHKFSPTKPRGRLLGAWAVVHRTNRNPTAIWANFAECYQPKNQQFWDSQPENMITKTARMRALKKSYPKAFPEDSTDGGYGSEQGALGEVVEVVAPKVSGVESLKKKLASKTESHEAEIFEAKGVAGEPRGAELLREPVASIAEDNFGIRQGGDSGTDVPPVPKRRGRPPKGVERPTEAGPNATWGIIASNAKGLGFKNAEQVWTIVGKVTGKKTYAELEPSDLNVALEKLEEAANTQRIFIEKQEREKLESVLNELDLSPPEPGSDG